MSEVPKGFEGLVLEHDALVRTENRFYVKHATELTLICAFGLIFSSVDLLFGLTQSMGSTTFAGSLAGTVFFAFQSSASSGRQKSISILEEKLRQLGVDSSRIKTR